MEFLEATTFTLNLAPSDTSTYQHARLRKTTRLPAIERRDNARCRRAWHMHHVFGYGEQEGNARFVRNSNLCLTYEWTFVFPSILMRVSLLMYARVKETHVDWAGTVCKTLQSTLVGYRNQQIATFLLNKIKSAVCSVMLHTALILEADVTSSLIYLKYQRRGARRGCYCKYIL